MPIIEIAKIIEQNGGHLYLVGGALRDEFLGKENKDEDYCAVGCSECSGYNSEEGKRDKKRTS